METCSEMKVLLDKVAQWGKSTPGVVEETSIWN